MTWNIYLSGEIHTEWRDEIKKKASKEKLNINLTDPVTNHEYSDKGGDVFCFQFLVKTSVRKQITGLKTRILQGVALFGTGKIEKQGRNDGIEFGVIHVPFINSAFSNRASAVYADDMRGGS